MPSAYVKKLADQHGVTTDEAEKKWQDAKKQASKQGKADNFAYVTSIFKSMIGETAMNLASLKARLKETAALDAQTYEQAIMAYQGSDESKALALRFCREFEPELIRLGFGFQPQDLGIHRAAWRGADRHKTQDVLTLFNKSGIPLVTSTDPSSAYQFCATQSMNLPRFGGQTSIVVAVTLDGACLVHVSFSFFGL